MWQAVLALGVDVTNIAIAANSHQENAMTMTRRMMLRSGLALAALATSGCSRAAKGKFEYVLSDAEWRKKLSPAAYAVMRQEDTERAGSSPLNKEKRVGTYHCKGCNLPLYPSRTKYESGTGWPSFWAPCRMRSVPKRIRAGSAHVSNAIAAAVAAIWGMSLMMVRNRRVNAIA